jgi:hypothetical protein
MICRDGVIFLTGGGGGENPRFEESENKFCVFTFPTEKERKKGKRKSTGCAIMLCVIFPTV